MATEAELQLDALFPEMNLSPVGPNLFIGHIDRVPFRMEMVLNAETLGLLFHTRFSKPKETVPEHPPVALDGKVAQLIAEKKADYEADQTQAWFNLFAAHELIERNELLPVLKEFAASIKACVDFDQQPCFACKSNIATEPTYHSETIHLICDSCQEAARKKAEKLLKLDPASLMLSLCYALIIAIPASLLWAVTWIMFIKIFEGRRVPHLILVGAFMAIAAAVAFPIAWMLKKIPNRPVRFNRTINIIACLATALVGELLITTYDFYQYNAELQSLGHLLYSTVAITLESGAVYIACKIVGFIILCAITLDAAKPNLALPAR